jgi:hypothetical protein
MGLTELLPEEESTCEIIPETGSTNRETKIQTYNHSGVMILMLAI